MQDSLSLKEYEIPDNLRGAQSLCKDLISEISKTQKDHKQHIAWLTQRFKIAMRQLRPDLINSNTLSSLFDEAELNEDPNIECEIEEEKEDKDKKAKKTRKKKQKAIPDHLPRKVVEHDLESSKKTCKEDGTELKAIGFDKKEELVYIPARYEVIEHRYLKYACKQCDSGVKRQPPQPTLIPQSYASSSLLAYIASSKYCHHLPLYRLEQMFKVQGIHLTRQVMSDWMIKLGEALTPLIGIMHEEILEHPVVCADETPVKLLSKNGVRTSTQCYMWQLSRWGPKPLVIFEYDQTRKKEVAKRLFKDYQGYVQVDGYAGYNELFIEGSGRKRVGCLAHCLRKFKDFLATLDKKYRASHSANKIRLEIKKLYEIEESYRGLSCDERHQKRQESNARNIISDIQNMVAQEIELLSKDSPYYAALNYCRSELPLISRYLEHGMIEVDNNFAENAIRPFALGRRNWLFICSEKGAQASANIYSLLITAKANKLDPYQYLEKIITEMPSCQTADDYAALLP